MATAKTATPLIFYVNNRRVVEPRPNPEESLLSYLRRKLHLTGTKLTCGEGGCGACTVTVSQWSESEQRPQHMSVNCCLLPLCCLHGRSVTTVEGIGTADDLHPVQERIAKGHGSQCGYCTPGVVMATYTELLRNPGACQAEIEEAVEANLCRCTGYRPIVQAVRSLASDWEPMTEEQQKQQQEQLQLHGRAVTLNDFSGCKRWNSGTEPEFPAELKNSAKWQQSELRFSTDRVTWFRPTSLSRLLELKQMHPDAKVIVGNTEVGIEMWQKYQHYTHLIHAGAIAELTTIEVNDNGLVLGAGVTLSRLLELCESLTESEQMSEYKKRVPRAFVQMLRLFAGRQIRNVASLGGNIMTASPISDLIPLLMACGAQLTLGSVDGRRHLTANSDFFVSYRQTAAKKDELLLSVFVPFASSQQQQLFSFKQSRRRQDDIAIVNAAMTATLDSSAKVTTALLCFGGVADKPTTAGVTSRLLLGRRWDAELLHDAVASLATELRLPSNAPGGLAAYRLTLAASLLHKFFHLVADAQRIDSATFSVDPSAIGDLQRRPVVASQLFDVVPDGQLSADPVGRPIVHASALKQATGEAVYVDDTASGEDELFMAPVLSQRASARVQSVDFDDALKLDGVVGFVWHRDVRGSNGYGEGERVFAVDSVRFVGEFVAGILATDRSVAWRAARRVKVTYSAADAPPVVTISEAVAAGSLFEEPAPKRFEVGDVAKAFKEAEFVIGNEMEIGGQEHFYLEPFACLVVPKDNGDELQLLATTQAPAHVQEVVTAVTGLPQNRVSVSVKRIGGGFGGKDTRSNQLFTAAAVAAMKFRRPVRSVLDRWTDMQMSGGRHPVKASYQLAANAEGRILGLRVRAFLNGGCTLDHSANVSGWMLLSLVDTYNMGSASIELDTCLTNTASNTGFRAFGAPQANAIVETAISQLAATIGMSQLELRERNFYNVGEVTLRGAPVLEDKLRRCWHECLRVSDYSRRLKEVERFNEVNKCRKRGIAVSPLTNPIGFAYNPLHQGFALIHVYLDGSVLLTHAGVEMGQGLHTKLLQVAARSLGVEMERIFISETATDKVANTSPAAASMSTDLNAPAVMDACQQIRERLAEFAHEDPKAGWVAWVNAAYMSGVSLSATGHSYVPAKENPDTKTGAGDCTLYFVYGAACSEVEIDCLTGDHAVLRSDLVVDLGASLNPAVDIGQIEGAFVQGCGLYTIEDIRHSPDGRMLSLGPGAYKIPAFGDIPSVFNVHLLRGSLNETPRAVYSSKAVGEPPLTLGVSVLQALRLATVDARRRQGDSAAHEAKWHSPATADRIRLACGGGPMLLANATSEPIGSGAPWEVRLSD